MRDFQRDSEIFSSMISIRNGAESAEKFSGPFPHLSITPLPLSKTRKYMLAMATFVLAGVVLASQLVAQMVAQEHA